MRIRSVTVFGDIGYPPNRTLLSHLGIFANHARHTFIQSGYEVQTLRLATPPFPTWLPACDRAAASAHLAIEAHAEGFEYLSLGPAQPGNHADPPDGHPARCVGESVRCVDAAAVGDVSVVGRAQGLRPRDLCPAGGFRGR